jgi:hypothetical protein
LTPALSTPPLVLDDPDRVERTAAALIANRHSARPARAPGDLAVVQLDVDGSPTVDGAPVAVSGLLATREVLVLATGEERAEALRSLLLSPTSALRAHPRVTVICDKAAAGSLRGVASGDHVVVVLGHRDPGYSHEHRISRESLGRVQRAEWVAQRRSTRAALLTGYTSTGGLSEAEQMRAAWRLPGVPALLEVAGRNTAGNAACSLPIVLALGGVREVTVVTSAWHVRAPYMFAPWRDHGLRVRFAVDWRGDWPRMLARELHEARAAARERREAFAEAGRTTDTHS